jgi:exosortase
VRAGGRTLSPRLLAAAAALVGLLLWVCWPTLVGAASRAWHDPQYNHALLVPFFAGLLLWLRRGLAPASARPSWWGLPLLALGVGMRLGGAYWFANWVEDISLLPLVAGLFGLFGGLPGLRWCWPAIAFLFFMVPLPHRLHVALAPALQHLATLASTYCLQTLGFCAVADGNAIQMGELRLSVVQACSGLSMLITFFALATGLALVVRRPLRDKVVILLSAAPIAVIANVARITATGVLHKTVGGDWANAVFHDLAGWLMMPLALALLALELKVLSHLLVEDQAPTPVPVVTAWAQSPEAPPPNPEAARDRGRRSRRKRPAQLTPPVPRS